MKIFLSKIIRRLFKIISSNVRLKSVITSVLLKLNLYDSMKKIYNKNISSVPTYKAPEHQPPITISKGIVIEHNISEQTQRMFEILNNNKE
ncbi:UNVERIFIED_ORG: hypothetical protein FHU00_0932 [Citrobacter freundii]|uniref:Uncharacterized protein n=1 Tax=Citrobacter braakii TaxID=57706 RepID=A0A2Z4BVC1_CITBR|nr:hypothetical protein [Citrobacter braakii]